MNEYKWNNFIEHMDVSITQQGKNPSKKFKACFAKISIKVSCVIMRVKVISCRI